MDTLQTSYYFSSAVHYIDKPEYLQVVRNVFNAHIEPQKKQVNDVYPVIMTGNLVQLTVGGYLYEQVGIITGLVYDIQEDTPWEIGINDDATNYDSSVKELPHVIRVSSFTFIPIQNFIPAKQSVNGNTAASIIDNNEYGPERFIALNNGTIYNNYDS